MHNAIHITSQLDAEFVDVMDWEGRFQIIEGMAIGRKRGIRNMRACRMLGLLLPIYGAFGNMQHPIGTFRPLLLRPAFMAQ